MLKMKRGFFINNKEYNMSIGFNTKNPIDYAKYNTNSIKLKI
jgi:hypothetical protein